MTGSDTWQVRETRLLRRRGRRVTQLFLLTPPASFSGRLRLGVIGLDRRTEFAARWTDTARAPLAFEAPVAGPLPGGSARADLLFEIEREAPPMGAGEAESIRRGAGSPPSSSPEGRELVPSRIQGHALQAGARIYVVPLLAAPPIAAALAALRRSRALRLGAARGIRPPEGARPAALARQVELARAIELEGRLQWLDLPALESSGLPAPLGRNAWSDPSGARLIAHIDACLARALTPGAPPDGAPPDGAPPDGAPPDGAPPDGARPDGPEPLPPLPAEDDRPPALGVWIEVLEEGSDLPRLGRMIARWNRRYLSPRLLCATPRDWRAAREGMLASAGGAPMLSPERPDPASR